MTDKFEPEFSCEIKNETRLPKNIFLPNGELLIEINPAKTARLCMSEPGAFLARWSRIVIKQGEVELIENPKWANPIKGLSLELCNASDSPVAQFRELNEAYNVGLIPIYIPLNLFSPRAVFKRMVFKLIMKKQERSGTEYLTELKSYAWVGEKRERSEIKAIEKERTEIEKLREERAQERDARK